MEYIAIGISAITLIVVIVLLVKFNKRSGVVNQLSQNVADTKNGIGDVKNGMMRVETASQDTKAAIAGVGPSIGKIEGAVNQQSQQIESLRQSTADSVKVMIDASDKMRAESSASIKEMRDETARGIREMREDTSKSLKEIREDTNTRLGEIKGVVDEQLQTTLDRRLKESFEQVVEHLSTLQKGLGEMQALSSNVSDLKKTLSAVKTRGIWGEMQLGSILEQVLAPDQYACNQITVPGSKDPVEFAIKLPGDGDNFVWLPIDSKFPGDTYAALMDAYENGDKAGVEEQGKALERVLMSEGKDIRDKYLHSPDTTDFGIMFLPVEGLYAEAVKRGMVEKLQSISITLAGPTTMTALLNSLRMGFRALAIQKRSNEVWKVLGNVKTEFEKYQKTIDAVQKKFKTAEDELEQLVGVRARVLTRSLRSIESGAADNVLDQLAAADSSADE